MLGARLWAPESGAGSSPTPAHQLTIKRLSFYLSKQWRRGTRIEDICDLRYSTTILLATRKWQLTCKAPWNSTWLGDCGSQDEYDSPGNRDTRLGEYD